ncbi:MAG: B12-binding domain-containing radical SAM protein [Ruminococcus flavefaciens]|nr:B12-binding domain-containing radical SAM protein [Ruminococcus flavefaciens]
MNVIAIDLPLNSVKAPDMSGYFNRILSKKRNQIIKERLIDKFDITVPEAKTFTLGLLSIASALKMEGHNIKYIIYDKFENSLADMEILCSKAQVALLSCKTTTYPIALEVAKAIKNCNPKIITIFGGPHCNVLPREVIAHDEVDYVSTGEGELTLIKLLSVFEGKTKLEEVPGVYYKKTDGIIVKNTHSSLIKNIDDIPEIEYEILPGDLNNYHIYVETSRGCKYQCSFCANPLLWEKQIRSYNSDKVYNRLTRLSKLLHANTLVHLVDPSYGNSIYIDTLCDSLIKHPISLKFSCDINALHVEKERIIKMYNAGVRMFCIGIESFSEDVLRLNKKPQTTELILNACRIIKENTDAFVKTYWIIGLPGESEETFRYSRDMAIKMLKDNWVDIVCEHVFVPYPGCDVYEHPENYKYKIIHKDWGNYDSRSFPLPGESEDFSMERVYISYLDFLRAQCEYYGISDRNSLLGLSNDYSFKDYKGGLI